MVHVVDKSDLPQNMVSGDAVPESVQQAAIEAKDAKKNEKSPTPKSR